MQPETQAIIEAGTQKLGFQHPIVGVHIRRTDKVGTEAALHNVEEYMKHVEDYYQQLEMTETVEKRRVFLASDDPRVGYFYRLHLFGEFQIIFQIAGD